MSRTRTTCRNGFTLIEVMVSLTLVALLVGAIYSGWYSIVKGSTAAGNAAAVAQRARMTMRLIEDSLLGACMYQQNGKYYPFLVESEGDFSSMSFVAHLPKSYLRSGKFDGAEIRRVTFTVEDGTNSEKDLVLRQNLPLLDPDQDEMENPLTVARNVKLFLLEFRDPKTGDWVDEWPYTNQVPREVRLQLALGSQLQNSDKVVQTLVGVVAPVTATVRSDWQLPAGPTPSGSTNGPRTNGLSSQLK